MRVTVRGRPLARVVEALSDLALDAALEAVRLGDYESVQLRLERAATTLPRGAVRRRRRRRDGVPPMSRHERGLAGRAASPWGSGGFRIGKRAAR